MPTIVHFDVASDDVARSKDFYKGLFDWEIDEVSGDIPYNLIGTKGLDGKAGVRGGMGKRMDPAQKITVYFGVDSVDDHSKKAELLGGKVVNPKMTVPGFGYLAICRDTEGNQFGLWQEDGQAR